MKVVIFICFSVIHLACSQTQQDTVFCIPKSDSVSTPHKDSFKVYTQYSHNENQYIGFDAPKAINRAADIDNEYFNNAESHVSIYYGRLWKGEVENDTLEGDSIPLFDRYVLDAGGREVKPYDCTIYATDILEIGLQKDTLAELRKLHQRLFPDLKGYAGWSVGHILVKYFGWKAYLFINKQSIEYDHCLKEYRKTQSYPVWRRPNIQLEAFLDLETQRDSIHTILLENEFGWGFSYQGYHSWITRFDILKECNWIGCPAQKYVPNEVYTPKTFITTPFFEYHDYDSHVVVFPPKKVND